MAMTGEYLRMVRNQHSLRGLCFGAFDPLHYGHIRLFRRASEQCRFLYAVTEADEIIRAEKGRDPFTTEKERAADLQGIRYIDGIGVRTEKHDRAYWASYFGADVLFVGDDWKGREWVGKELALEIVYLPRTEGIDSTYLRGL